MKHDIFIKSYPGDFPWLEWALRSIEKNCQGFNECILIVPCGTMEAVPYRFPWLRVEEIIEHGSGYLFQQAVKVASPTYSTADTITFLDSDCFVFETLTAESLFKDGRSIYLKTLFETLLLAGGPVGEVSLKWKQSTEACVGWPVLYEYMRRHPMTYWTQDIRDFSDYVSGRHGKSTTEYIVGAKNFSEFNCMGAWMDQMRHDRYHWIDTQSDPFDPVPVKQHWSGSGITEALKEQMKNQINSR